MMLNTPSKQGRWYIYDEEGHSIWIYAEFNIFARAYENFFSFDVIDDLLNSCY